MTRTVCSPHAPFLPAGRSKPRFFLASVGLTLGMVTACGSGFLDGLSGQSAPDSGRDAASASPAPIADASKPIACDAAATFCDDFDEEPAFAKWSDSGATVNGKFERVEGGTSSPYAFRAGWDSGVANTYALISRWIGGGRKTIRCELDMFIPQTPAVAEIDYLTFTSEIDGLNEYKVYFSVSDSLWSIAEFGRVKDGGRYVDRTKAIESSSVPIGRWTRVVFTTDSESVSISFDGNPPATLSGLKQYYTPSQEIHIGISFAGEGAPSSYALYDNVACDYGN